MLVIRHPLVHAAVTTAILVLCATCQGGESQPAPSAGDWSSSLLGWATNGPAVYAILRFTRTNLSPGVVSSQPNTDTANIPTPITNRLFHHYLPASLNDRIWTNFIAHTNGRNTALWSVLSHPPGWPARAPSLVWNTNSLAWGMRGLTAISQCWEDEGASGQAPVTALSPRHGYVRGHSMGPDGFTTTRNGKKVWFATTANSVVQATVKDAVYRIGAGRDYTILLFDHDLPASIEPLRVVAGTNVLSRYPSRPGAPHPIFETEQGGNVSADVPGFSVNTWKGGDSGSPDLLPMPGELVFFGGRSTSGPSSDMQADMNALCARHGLRPDRYQLQWVDLSGYPAY